MSSHFRSSLIRARGATATETIMMIILVGLVVMAGVKMFGGGVADKADFANDMVGSVTTENQEAERLRAAGRKAEERRRAHGGGSGATAEAASAGAGDDARRGDEGAPAQDARAPAQTAGRGAQQDAAQDGSGGFNPFLIPIVVGLLGLLGYVVLKSQKG